MKQQNINAELVLASKHKDTGTILYTVRLTYPRFILPEVNTHRMFCLSGDSMLEFDLPGGSRKGKYKRVWSMRLDEFVDKWDNGARRYTSNKKKETDVSWVKPDTWYSPIEIASRLGLKSQMNINKFCRDGTLISKKDVDERTWLVLGQSIINWRTNITEHSRFDIKKRLRSMRIRQLNEDTRDIQFSYVKDAIFSGRKMVYEVQAGEYKVAGSKDHHILTKDGWKSIEQLTTDDFIVVKKSGKRNEDKTDPLRLKKFDGQWRSVWQRKQKEALQEINSKCSRCESNEGTDIHHIIPVYEDPSKAFDKTNITLLCKECHNQEHSIQGWQGGTYLYGALAKVTNIVLRGEEDTFDLEIAGNYPNFLANGIVVHNSRNTASSRAIPTHKIRKQVSTDPVIPIHCGKAQKGMQAYEEVVGWRRDLGLGIIKAMKNCCVAGHWGLEKLGFHKQVANRYLEPWMWTTQLVSFTDINNFLLQRNHPAAEPHIHEVAKLLQDLVNKVEQAFDQGDLGWDLIQILPQGGWHLPFVNIEERRNYDVEQCKAISAGRCAHVSYFDIETNTISKPETSMSICKKLIDSSPRHFSPIEHQAQALYLSNPLEVMQRYYGNFKDFVQFRKQFLDESGECVR